MTPAEHGPTTTALTVADLNTEVNCEARILDTRLAEALGFDRPRDVRKLVRRHLPALKTLGTISAGEEAISERGGRPAKAFYLNKKQALYVCTKSETEKATEITLQVVEVYDEVTSRPAVSAAPRTIPPEEPPPVIRRRVSGPVTREVLETYASWLHNECALLMDELYPGKPIWERGVILTNPGGAYHVGAPGTLVPPPSTRATDVLRLVRCPLPKPRKPKLLPRR